MGSLFPCLASGKMWENFKLGKILENRNKNVKWNTVTYPLNLSCQGKNRYFFLEINVLLICQHLMLSPHTHSQYLYNFLHTYVCSSTKTVGQAPTWTHNDAGSTKKIVSELIIFILSSSSHFWIGVLMLLGTLCDVIGQFWLQIELPIYYAGAPSP